MSFMEEAPGKGGYPEFCSSTIRWRRFAYPELTLTILRAAPTYTLEEVALSGELFQQYSAVGTEDLRNDLRHLRDRDCVRIEIVEGIWFATLTRIGGEVAGGLISVDGVARPGP
jgi:hypothetical protein